ncbi:MAG: TetR family transcriptional regulator [Endozoicomonas sp.]
MNIISPSSHTSHGRRMPTQERSRSRVDAILNATRDLILEKGSSGLKIHELAERAGVTPSSIYQYFPNKRAIIHALDERYMNKTHELLAVRLENIKSLEEGFQALEEAMDDYYDWYTSEPVIYDIWCGMAADKQMQDMELQSSRESARIAVNALSPFIDEGDRAELESYALLLTHLAGATIRLCIRTEKEEALKLKNAYKRLLKSMRLSMSTAKIWLT